MAAKTLKPATLEVVQAIEAAISAPMVAAVSGGADSLALAAGALLVSRRKSLPLRAVVIDHGLQGESAEVSAAAVATLANLGVAADVVKVDVTPAGDGLEAAARAARYAALAENADAGEVVLLGHTLDDQAESVLLGLARGSGTRSLAGMPVTRGCFHRPLLGIRRSTTRELCRELGISWWEDPQNHQDRFSRARVRQTLLPQMEAALGPGVVQALARTAKIAAADADYLDELAGKYRGQNPAQEEGRLDCVWLSQLPPAIRSRVIRDWLRSCGAGELHAVHIAAVDALILDWRGQKWIEVPRLRVFRRDGQLGTCLA
ncbi:MAG: tRNA lysidine(34) synthetase TilS [Propionibacteriaceae bacterium]|jgi:tRNA(Ile)-lysidine synthase|nr:tRNA lysidine(34) synthetase TilS [Propionibacteriaceae bacterium]